MITHESDWQKALKTLVTDPLELLSIVDLCPNDIAWSWDKQFPLRVPRSFIDRIKKGDPQDPILKQVLSTPHESQISENFTKDPLKESAHNPIPGLIHKFPGRVLLTFSGACAVHCRYCFRRYFPYSENNPGKEGWNAALAYISAHKEIHEVILSGGDPLVAQDKTIELFLKKLEDIPHVSIVRLHTRVPVVIPSRVTEELLTALSGTRFRMVMVYHINHPQEIIDPIGEGVQKLRGKQITVLNHTVLLKSVNDNFECLKILSLRLFEQGILPYYVNFPDPVAGSCHFAVSLDAAKALQVALREALPGYLVPKFVKEIPFELGKIPVEILTSSDV